MMELMLEILFLLDLIRYYRIQTLIGNLYRMVFPIVA